MKHVIPLQSGDALLVVHVQNDFLPGGALAVIHGDLVVPVLNQYIAIFESKRLSIFASRDWHPANHCSFLTQGGPWPPHCVQGSPGAQFAPDLRLPPATAIISSATRQEREAYSGFEDTDLHDRLQSLGIGRLFIGGLATDYCVLATVKDGLSLGYKVFLLQDAIHAVNLHPDDGKKAREEMLRLGAVGIDLDEIRGANA
jgi:nicotinamidase/pyrazinamidase